MEGSLAPSLGVIAVEDHLQSDSRRIEIVIHSRPPVDITDLRLRTAFHEID